MPNRTHRHVVQSPRFAVTRRHDAKITGYVNRLMDRLGIGSEVRVPA